MPASEALPRSIVLEHAIAAAEARLRVHQQHLDEQRRAMGNTNSAEALVLSAETRLAELVARQAEQSGNG